MLMMNNLQQTFNLQDLLLAEQANLLTEYLSLSIENLGPDTKVSVTTVEEIPTIYSAMFSNVLFSDLNYLIAGNARV